jgi:hypothetical protein
MPATVAVPAPLIPRTPASSVITLDVSPKNVTVTNAFVKVLPSRKPLAIAYSVMVIGTAFAAAAHTNTLKIRD